MFLSTTLNLLKNRAENRTIPAISFAKVRQTLDPIPKECPLEVGWQLILICLGLSRSWHRLSYILGDLLVSEGYPS